MRTIATLLFPQFELLDVYGPLEMLGMFPDDFRLIMVAESDAPVASTQGPRTAIDARIDEMDPAEILLIPGGRGTRREVSNQRVLEWLKNASASAELVTSVCTGAFLLARAGLLDDRRATTNKLAFSVAAEHGPRVDWQGSARWVWDGKFVTASGVSAGIDMSLAVIRDLLGEDAARDAALWSEYVPNTDPDNDPFAVSEETIR
ncbi:MAG: DJ-1/PfpI family protein [Pseudomonadota bacterium]